MRRSALALVALIFCIMISQYASAATYYISSSSGKDSNDGKTPNTAWQNYTRINNVTWKPGDQFLFRCGDTWRIFQNGAVTTKGNGTPTAPITIGSYGTCKNKLSYPIFTRTHRVTKEFVSAGTNLYQIPNRSDIALAGPNWFFNGQRAAWIENHDSGCPGSMTLEYEVCYNPSRATTYVRTKAGNPNTLNAPGAEYLDSKSKSAIEINHGWITLKQVRVWKTANCISINSSSTLNVTIDDIRCEEMAWSTNVFTASVGGRFGAWAISTNSIPEAGINGFFTLKNSYLYGSGRDFFDTDRSMPDGNITIVNNTFDTGYNHGIAYLGKDAGTNARAPGTWLIKNNIARNVCGGWGFGEGSSGSGGFSNLIFEGNTVTNLVTGKQVKNGTISRYQMVAPGPDCGDAPSGFSTDGNGGPTTVSLYRNIVVGAGRGITLKGGSGLKADVYNNTIINSSEAGIFLTNIGTSRFYNNVFSDTSSFSKTRAMKCQANNCASVDIQNNYFSPGNSSSYVTQWGTTNRNLAQSKSALLGFKPSNIGNAYGAEPSSLFVNKNAGNFTPGTGSPLIDAGRIKPPTFSYSGVSLDIGAIEKAITTLTDSK